MNSTSQITFHDTLTSTYKRAVEATNCYKGAARKSFEKVKAATTRPNNKESERLTEINDRCLSAIKSFGAMQISFTLAAAVLCFTATILFVSEEVSISLAIGVPCLAGGAVMVKLVVECDAIKGGLDLYRELGNELITAIKTPKVREAKSGKGDEWLVKKTKLERKLDQAHILKHIKGKKLMNCFQTHDEVHAGIK